MKSIVVFLFLSFSYPAIAQSGRVFDANGNLINEEKKEVVYEIVQPDGRKSIRPYMPTGNFEEIKQYDNGNKHVVQLRVKEEIQSPVNPLAYDPNGTTATIKIPVKVHDIPPKMTTLRQGEIKLLPREKQQLIIKRTEVQDKINTSIREQETIEHEKRQKQQKVYDE